MTKVDFYTGSPDKLRTVCQLSQKAMQHGLYTVISLPDESTLDALDRLMWHYPETSFLPHCRADSESAAQTQVILSCRSEDFPHHDLLINLQDGCPPYFSRFERVIEIVGRENEDAKLGRERYSYYKDRGYELRHFDLSTGSPT